jgi:FkbM family methyltransferase
MRRSAHGLLSPSPQERHDPHPVYLGNNTILLRTVHGFKLFVDSRDVSIVPHLVMDGSWEPAVRRVIDARVRPGMRVIEVGSNVGFHSVHLASAIGPKGALHCFEANAGLAQNLAYSLEVNGFRLRARVYAQAAMDQMGEAEFKVFARHLGASSFLVGEETARQYSDTIQTVRVPTTTLDATCADLAAVDFIKIDAEGAEPFVLAGAKDLLARSKSLAMLLEFGPSFWPTVSDAADFLGGLTAQGFAVHKVSEEGAILPTRIEPLLDPTQLHELLLTR